MRVIRTATLSVVALLMVAASAVGTTAQSPSPSSSSLPGGLARPLPPIGLAGNGVIAFASGGDIWVVQPDGSGRRRLTDGPELEHSPAWSADGTRLAYWSQDELGAPARSLGMVGTSCSTRPSSDLRC